MLQPICIATTPIGGMRGISARVGEAMARDTVGTGIRFTTIILTVAVFAIGHAVISTGGGILLCICSMLRKSLISCRMRERNRVMAAGAAVETAHLADATLSLIHI